jgi:AcrR family transcriptional regulator
LAVRGRRGFAGLTVDDVCEEAGVSKGTFYGYFDSKRGLLIRLLDDDAASLEASIEDLGTATLSGLVRLEGLPERCSSGETILPGHTAPRRLVGHGRQREGR